MRVKTRLIGKGYFKTFNKNNMRPIEILNTISKKIFDLEKSEDGFEKNEFVPFVDPAEFNANTFKVIKGQLTQVSRDEYLKECIGYFLLNVTALKNQNLLKGYNESKDLVTTQNGFGEVDDISFTVKTPRKNTTYRIRIFDLSKSSINESENYTMLMLRGTYIIVKSLDEFYSWYVSKFGDVEI
jgi:hypothetical protein